MNNQPRAHLPVSMESDTVRFGWSVTGNAEQMLGEDVSRIDDMNGDGHDDLVALRRLDGWS